MSDAPEQIWAFYTPDDFDDSATITAYETVQHGGQKYVRADRIEALEAENARLLAAIHQSIWALEPYAELAKHHAADAPEWGPFDSVTAQVSIMHLRDAAKTIAELKDTGK